ncbi:MAG: alkaline phosphatase D family protein [Bdellovibrionaceae bacterium]|nr:alkaline phosphatase D family protein [Pseudobdellovibrionaceae bacterium]
MNRRTFLKSVNFFLYSLLIGFRAKANMVTTSWIPSGRRIPAMQGYTDDTSTQVILLVAEGEKLHYAVTDDRGKTLAIDSVQPTSYPNSRYRLDRLTLTKLPKSSIFTLTVYNSKNETIDTRMFQTLDISDDSMKIGLMSCMDDRVNNHKAMWKSVSEKQADILFFLGDNVYVDDEEVRVTPDTIWERHVETRMALDVYQTELLTPIIGIWDDHDYAMDDGDTRFTYKDESLRIFKAFFGSNDGTYLSNGPGVSSYVSLFNQRFVFLDSRYYREKGSRMKGKIWGSEQIAWVQAKLDNQCFKPVWFINGSQFYGGYQRYESVERESISELNQMISIAKNLAAPVIFVAGDVHYSEISNLEKNILGYESVELTSSAIHSTPADDVSDNPRRTYVTQENNYMIVETKVHRSALELNINIYGRNQTYHTTRRTVAK